jgi:hypothetical protein
MRILCSINKLVFLIIFCQVFIGEAFALDQIPLKDNKINSPKAKKNNEIIIYEKNEDADEEEDNILMETETLKQSYSKNNQAQDFIVNPFKIEE